MKITATVSALRNALDAIKPAYPERSTLPVLHQCLFRPTTAGGLSVTTTNLEMWLTAPVVGAVAERDPATDDDLFGFPASFADLHRTLNYSDLSKDATATLHQTGLECVLTTETFSHTFKSGYPEEYPDARIDYSSTKRQYSISLDAFLCGLRSVAPAKGTDETRPVLTGVLLEVVTHEEGRQGLRFIATDAHRLAIYTTNRAFPLLEENPVVNPAEDTLHTYKPVGILPPGAVALILAHCNGVEAGSGYTLRLIADYGMLAFFLPVGKPLHVATRLVEGTYPDYHRVVPTTHTWLFTVDRLALLRALRLLKSTANDNANRVAFTVSDGVLTLTAHSRADTTSATIPLSKATGNVSFSVNHKYVTTALDAFRCGMVEIAGNEPLKPFCIFAVDPETGDTVTGATGLFYLLMPMKTDADKTD